jgi:hypothetical protein
MRAAEMKSRFRLVRQCHEYAAMADPHGIAVMCLHDQAEAGLLPADPPVQRLHRVGVAQTLRQALEALGNRLYLSFSHNKSSS